MNADVTNTYTIPYGTDQQLAVSTSVVQLVSTGFVSPVRAVDVQIQGANVRVTFDGSNPTDTNGFIYTNGTGTTWSLARAKAAKFIRDDSTDAVVHAQPVSW